MPRFRVSDLMINVGEGSGGICEIITNCGGVTELCVENTQGCAFTENCLCTIQTACGDQFTCQCSICTPCSQRTCGCTCTACSYCSVCSVVTPCGRSICTFNTACGISIRCTPTFIGATQGGLQPEHLEQLKRELRTTLERVEAEEQRLKEQLQPQTLDDVDQLEQKLAEAQDELRKRRKELEQREQGKEK